MDYENFFKDMFESIPLYKKIELIIILFQNDAYSLEEGGFLKSDNNSLCEEFKNISFEHNEEYLSYIKNEEKSISERFLKK